MVVVVLVLVEAEHEQPRGAPVPLYDISVDSKKEKQQLEKMSTIDSSKN